LRRQAAFLDRDGTINVNPPGGEYVTRIEDFQLLPGAVEGMARLARCGYLLVVVSNQRGVAKGLISDQVLRATEEVIQDDLRRQGAEIARFYYCPHEIEEECDCRKPRPGMLLRAQDALGLDAAASWMIGDSDSDIEAGGAAGCRTVYLGDGDRVAATLTASSLADAASAICAECA
jgi:D-glycero-D-manno-heptose 1,7-bisphosphate phosphatase